MRFGQVPAHVVDQQRQPHAPRGVGQGSLDELRLPAGLIHAAIDDALPAIVNGDFNAGPASASMAYWQSLGWRIDGPTDLATFVGGTQAIDFNTSLGAQAWTVVSSTVVDDAVTRVASDHFPVVTTYAVATVPVPATPALMLLGVGLLAGSVRRRA